MERPRRSNETVWFGGPRRWAYQRASWTFASILFASRQSGSVEAPAEGLFAICFESSLFRLLHRSSQNEVIVPVSMAPLQKEVYKSILSTFLALFGIEEIRLTLAQAKTWLCFVLWRKMLHSEWIEQLSESQTWTTCLCNFASEWDLLIVHRQLLRYRSGVSNTRISSLMT